MRKKNKRFAGAFAPICHFFGYQGRSATPSLFDCRLGTTHGFAAGILIQSNLTGYCTTARGLSSHYQSWNLGGIPLISFIKIRERSSFGINKPVVPSYDVDLNCESFKELQKH